MTRRQHIQPRALPVNIILTGIARSGTSLACTLLNRLPNSVALLEPMSPRLLEGLEPTVAIPDRIDAFFTSQRASLLARGEAISKARDGEIPENPFSESPDSSGLRPLLTSQSVVRFEKPLGENFRLVIKHPNCFTALLGVLVPRFPCFALVRNPLAVLLSWNTTQSHRIDGRQPAAEAFDAELRRRLEAEKDPIGRQLAMLSWSFEQYSRHLPPQRVIHYEQLVASAGRVLAGIDPEAASLQGSLESRNANRLYAAADIQGLSARLLESPGAYWDHYSRESVRDLAGVLLGN